MLTDVIDSMREVFSKQHPITTEVNGLTYSVREDGTLGDYIAPVAPPVAPPLTMSTLTGFISAYQAKIDAFPDEVAVHVEGVDSVSLISLRADNYGRRHVWMRAKALPVTAFRFGEYYEPEPFLIALQSAFAPSQNVSALQTMASNLTAGSSISTADDGFTQVVTVVEGAVTRNNVAIPNRLPLEPYRTFREIVPVSSDFMLRIKGRKEQLPTLTLLEVDGGRWKVDTIAAVGKYIQAALLDATVVA